MIQLGFTKKDAMRAFWAFVIPFAVALGASANSIHDLSSAKAAAFAALVSALVSLKNFVLKDGTVLKG